MADNSKSLSYEVKFKTTFSWKECLGKHPGEQYMVSRMMPEGEFEAYDPKSLWRVLIFQNRRQWQAVKEIYEEFCDECKIYNYDLRVKHGRYVTQPIGTKKKEPDPRFRVQSEKQKSLEIKQEISDDEIVPKAEAV